MAILEMLKGLWEATGFVKAGPSQWQNYIMIAISIVLFYLAVVKGFEPLLLLPIAFGMFIINIPGSYEVLYGADHDLVGQYTKVINALSDGYLGMSGEALEKWKTAMVAAANEGSLLAEINQAVDLNGDGFVGVTQLLMQSVAEEGGVSYVPVLTAANTLQSVSGEAIVARGESYGLFHYLGMGVQYVIFPPIIFLGIGAMTDFGPLIANPKSLLMGAGAQLGVFLAFFGARALGFNAGESSAIGIIGGADGPTAIYVTQKLAPRLLSAIAIAAYSYMALIPIIQPFFMKLLTTKEQRKIRMDDLRPVSKKEKLVFPIVVTLIVGVLLPDALPLLGILMLGNFMKESLCVERLVKTASNELMNIVTIFLGLIVGTKAQGGTFLTPQTLGIIAMGLVAFSCGTIGGLLTAQVINLFSKKKINPLIGSAGVSAVPMAARVSQKVGQEECPDNYLLMHAMGPNVAGVIGSAVAAGVFLALFA